MTHGLRSAMDIFFLDETGYLQRGMNMFPKIPKLWGPVYCFWYKILSFIQGDAVSLFYLNFGLMAVLLALAAYFFLLRFRVMWPIALWLSLMVLIAPYNLTTFPKVSHFATMAAMLAFIAAYQVKHHLHRYTLIAVTFLILAYARPEFYLSFLLMVLLIIAGISTKKVKLQWSPWLVGGLIFIALLHIGLGFPLGTELRGYKRSFIAFGEHFSYNYSNWNDLEGYLWLTWETITQSQFGESKRFSEALLANPGMMFTHFMSNARLYLSHLDETLVTTLLPVKKVPFFLRMIIPVLLIAPLTLPDIRKAYWSRLKHHRAIFTFLFLLALPSILSCIVIYPRGHYIINQIPLIIWLTGELLSTIVRTYASSKVCGFVLPVILLAVVVYFVIPRLPSDYEYFELRKENGKLNNLTVLNLLDEHADVVEGKTLLSHEGDFRAFIEPNIQFVNAIDKKETGFQTFLDNIDPDMIYCTQTIFKNPNYLNDKEWIRFIEDMNEKRDDWQYLPVNGGDQDFLLVKSDLYEALNN